MSEKQPIHLRLRRSSVEDNLPKPGQLEYGEPAINFFAGKEKLSIKNSANKIVSTDLNENVAQTILDTVNSHVADTNNPHKVTKAQVGLGNVDNTSDAKKPLSEAAQNAIGSKVDQTEIVDNLTTSASDKPLSARQGKILYERMNEVSGGATADLSALQTRVASVEDEINSALAECNVLDEKVDTFIALVNKTTV